MMDSNLQSAIESELASYLRGHNQRAGYDMGAEEARDLLLEATLVGKTALLDKSLEHVGLAVIERVVVDGLVDLERVAERARRK